jgi:curved DNA-binding protein CbpA
MLHVLYFCLDSKGYYAILEVSENANFQEIKRAYRKLARKYHPDRNNSSFAEDMIKRINASFEVLSDKDKRIEYDRMEIDFVQSAEADAYNNYKNYNTAEQVHPDPFYNYYDYNHTSKTSADYKHNDNYYSVRGTSKNSLNEEINVKIQSMITDIDTPKGRFHIIVEPSLCMAFGSCETLAPKVFVVEKDKMINPKARIASETGANYEAILAAAQTCPTKAIKIIDRFTGEQLFP